jgi:hypothetical protein
MTHTKSGADGLSQGTRGVFRRDRGTGPSRQIGELDRGSCRGDVTKQEGYGMLLAMSGPSNCVTDTGSFRHALTATWNFGLFGFNEGISVRVRKT